MVHKKQRKMWPFPHYEAGGGGGGGRKSHSLGNFFAAQKLFVCHKEAPKPTFVFTPNFRHARYCKYLCVKTSCTNGGRHL